MPAVAAAAIYGRVATAALKGNGINTADSAIVEDNGGKWFAVAGPVSGARRGLSVIVYRWDGSLWRPVGDIGGLMLPDLNGPGSITAVYLTGSPRPDFLVTGNGADWQPASVVSDVGGTWHAVPFEYGNGALTTLIDEGRTQGRFVETRVNACGCAFGPESYLWMVYRDGTFRPSNPPGPVPPCTVNSLTSALEPNAPAPLSPSPPLALTRVACADGWALAVGMGAAYTGHVMGLFEQQGDKWKDLQLDDGADLAYEVGEYDFPIWLFERLGAELGPGVAAEVAAARPPAHLGLPSSAFVSGVMIADGADWLVAATQPSTGNAEGPSWVSVAILRWSGTRWAPVGQVDHIADHGSTVGWGMWYSAVGVRGSSLPGFRILGSPPSGPGWSVVVAYAGRRWQVITE